MRTASSAVVLLAASLAATSYATPAQADPLVAGAREYAISCAGCHGEKGEGNGPFADQLKAGAPSLTGIAAANGGVFPLLDMFMIIDGRSGLRGHGGDMPIWGDRYRQDPDGSFGQFGAEVQVRARILELVFYLQSIQTPPASKS